MHRITQKHFPSQGENSTETAESGNFGQNALIDLYESAYSAIVQPQKVIVIPRYFIQHWLPLLGPARAWLALAFRQAAFVSRTTTQEVISPLSVRLLARWSGLSHGHIGNLLEDLGPLSWFVRKVAPPPSRTESTIWGVQAGIPLTPGHIHLLARYLLRQHGQQPEASLTSHLQQLLNELPSMMASYAKSSPPPPSPDQLNHPVPLARAVSAIFQTPLDAATTTLCDEITARIVQPGNTIALTHYFLDRWLPEFKNGEAWLVPVLRAQVYAGGSGVGQVTIPGGKTRLANALGVTVRSVRRWLSDLSQGALGRFIALLNASSSDLTLEITLREPLHPDDQGVFNNLVTQSELEADKIGHASGQNWTHLWSELDTPGTGVATYPDKNGHKGGQKETPGGTILDTDPEFFGHEPGQNQTPGRTKDDTLIAFNPNPKLNSANENDNFLLQALIESAPGQATEQSRSAGEGEGRVVSEQQPADSPLKKQTSVWDWDYVLQTGGLGPKHRAEMQRNLNQPAYAERFLGWLLYGYAYRKQHQGAAGIQLPVQFAASRYLHSSPEPDYLSLAGESPGDLADWLHRSPYIRLPERRWEEIIAALKANHFLALLEAAVPPELRATAPDEDEDAAVSGAEIPAEADSPPQKNLNIAQEPRQKGGNSGALIDAPAENSPISEQTGGAPVQADTRTAHELWELLRQAAGITSSGAYGGASRAGQVLTIVVGGSYWATQFAQAIEAGRMALTAILPGWTIRLQAMGLVSQAGKRSARDLGVVEELTIVLGTP